MSSGNFEAEHRRIEQVQHYLEAVARLEPPDTHLSGAWQDFYQQYAPVIRRNIRASGVRAADVDDCFQEIWIHLLTRLPQFQADQERGTFGAWLHAVVRNFVVSRARRRHPARELCLMQELRRIRPGHAAPVVDQVIGEEELERLYSALEDLRHLASPLSYRVFEMRALDGRGAMEVAWRLGLTQQQVWFRHHRVKKLLQRLLDGKRGDGVQAQAADSSDDPAPLSK